MSEPLVLEWPRAAAPAPTLPREVGRLAGRVASLLEELVPGEEAARQVRLLRALADAYADAEPAAPERLARMADALGFTDWDLEILVLAGLAEEHEGIATTLAGLHPWGQGRASAALAAQLLCDTLEDRWRLRRLLEAGAAVASGAVRLAGDGPLFHRSLEVAPALWSVLHGADVWPHGVEVDTAPPVAAGLERWLATPACRRAAAALRSGEPSLLLLSADDPGSAARRAAALAEAAGVGAVRLTVCEGCGGAEAGVAAHLAARGAVPVVVAGRGEGKEEDPFRALAAVAGPVIVCARPGTFRPDLRRPVVHLEVGRLDGPARAAVWREAMPELAGEAERFGSSYAVEPAVAVAIAADARAAARLLERPVEPADLVAAVRGRAHTAAGAAVVLRRPTATWDQLVLPPDRRAQLAEAVQRLRGQSRVLDEWGFLSGRPGARGVRLLLSGPPGVGKTLSAEVLAHTLGVDLLIVDLAKVVSKWLGETEKHLAEVFDAAEHAQAVLLFDEADALFGRRTEVSDAHDRYANLETAYLLYRLERFEGLTVLSTNLQRNLDPAFLRRIEFVIELDEPDVAGRLELWRRHLPSHAPLDPAVELPRIAALYPLTGALIRNAAVAAAFLAAGAGTPITLELLVHAIHREYQKAGRTFPGLPPGMTER